MRSARKSLLVFAVFLVLCAGAQAAEIHRYVNTISTNTPGGDGTTPSGDPGESTRAFVSLNVAEAALEQDLTDNGGDVMIIHCDDGGAEYGDFADTVAVIFADWTTGAASYIQVQVDVDLRHNGAWDETAYRLYVANGIALTISEDFVRHDGLQVGVSATNAADQDVIYIASISAGNDLRFSNMVVRGADNDTYRQVLLRLVDTDCIVTAWNSVFYDAGNSTGPSYGIYANDGIAGVNLYNVTVDNCYRGVRGTGTWVETNVLIRKDAAGNVCWRPDAGHTRTYSASSDDTADDQGGDGNRINQTFTFAGAGDYHLDAADEGALDFGDDLTTYGFTTDIDGETRVAPWDIGADEYISAASPTPTPSATPTQTPTPTATPTQTPTPTPYPRPLVGGNLVEMGSRLVR